MSWILPLPAADHISEEDVFSFTDQYCARCHNDTDLKGRLDLTSLTLDLENPENARIWVKVHDRLKAGEMPPKKARTRPESDELSRFLDSLAGTMNHAEEQIIAREGRAGQRRLNRYEYENVLRDLLHAPWLQVRERLPEDGEAFLSNKVAQALEVSHVHFLRFMDAADYSIREAIKTQSMRPKSKVTRYYARDHRRWTQFRPGVNQNASPDRDPFPVLDGKAQPDVRALRAPITVGNTDPEIRNREAVGWVSSRYPSSTVNATFSNFTAPVTGRYRVRFSGYTVWVGPGGFWRLNIFKDGAATKVDQPPQWYVPNFDDISKGRRPEPITVYTQSPTGIDRRVGAFDLLPDPSVTDLGEVLLIEGETLAVDAARFFRSRPTPKVGMFTNPLAQKDGLPGAAFQWMEVEGPLEDESISQGYHLLFGDLPLKHPNPGDSARFEVVSSQPRVDAERLIRAFAQRAYRRPIDDSELQLFFKLFEDVYAQDVGFTEAMISAYTAILTSPGFLFVQEKPGQLDDYMLATRLSLFLWNSEPDDELRGLAARGTLSRPEVLRAQADRMIDDAKSRRFAEAFTDYWLDLKNMYRDTPSTALYNDYDLDDALTEAALDESRLFFHELVRENLPARNVIDSDFTFLNERLATHYGIPGVMGAAMRKVLLPTDSPRGGVMTQASVLKVTANGTTTSPVLRGVWITERIFGYRPPPPPPVPAVEPDIRGAVTIREQIAKHTEDPSCASCHSIMDPPGFALESFDVLGGWRESYRAISDKVLPEIGFGKNGHPFQFHHGLPVDSSGELRDGRKFEDINDFKGLLLKDERLIVRNLAHQLITFATGAPVGFSDRQHVDRLLAKIEAQGYGVRSMIHGIIQSDLFRKK